jgi:hypothetical protein
LTICGEYLSSAHFESTGQVVINETNFPDDNFRNFLLSESFGADGVLTTNEIANEFYMEVYGKEIASLKGIEFFTELKEIDCSRNKLTSLDVSKNTKLTELYCEGNQIRGAQMDALIASLPNKKGNQLEFGVRDETKDIANDNDITMAQVAAAKAKGWIPMVYDGEDYTNYGGSDVSTIGIPIDSKNFPDFYFRRYLLDQDFGTDGVLTQQKIAEVTELWLIFEWISDLTGIEHFTALQELSVYNNSIKTLDLSKNTALESLDCSDNIISTLILPDNGKLAYLDCGENKLTSLTIPAGLQTLSCATNPDLTSLDLSAGASLKSLDCSECALTSLILPNTTTSLVKIECYKNQIKGENMTALVENLPTVESGDFYVLTLTDPDEGNEITTTHVATAKAKGWKVWAYTSTEWQEYEGSEPTAIMTITATEGIQSGYYYTLDGQRVAGKPVRKGIYILNGKKVVVK